MDGSDMEAIETLEAARMKYRIGIFHYKVGGTDGVSLELDKWKSVFEQEGHSVFLGGGISDRRLVR